MSEIPSLYLKQAGGSIKGLSDILFFIWRRCNTNYKQQAQSLCGMSLLCRKFVVLLLGGA